MSIFEYSDYKRYLQETLASFPKKGYGQTLRVAEHLGVHPTLVSQILNGERDFSTEQIHKLTSYLGLQSVEADYLILLLQYERSGTIELKKYYKNKIDEIKKSSLSIAKRLSQERNLGDLERSVFYSSWIYLAVWLYLSVDEGQTIENVAQRLFMSRSHVAEILHFLKEVQLCSEENGVYKMQAKHVHLEFGSAFLARHHANWRVKSLQRIDDLTAEEMMFTSPFSISKKDFLRIREEIMKLIKSTSDIIKDSPAEEIACMNFDLFWIKK